MTKMPEKSILILFTLSIFLSGCATVINPATGRKEFIMIGTQQEVSIGSQVATEVETRFKLSNNESLVERVNRIGMRVSKVSDRQDLTYRFKVLENKETNALSTPGGYVYVNSGLMEKADDDELAAVIAHEVGHIAARHAVQSMQTHNLISAGAIGVSLLVKSDDFQKVEPWANLALNLIMSGYSKEDEFEADKLGVRYAYYAGFDPNGSVTFLEKLQKEEKERPLDKVLVYLRSHPLNSERIARARAYAAYLKEYDPAGQYQNRPVY